MTEKLDLQNNFCKMRARFTKQFLSNDRETRFTKQFLSNDRETRFTKIFL